MLDLMDFSMFAYIKSLSRSRDDPKFDDQQDEDEIDVGGEKHTPDEAESEGGKVVLKKTDGINGWERVEGDEAGEDAEVELGDVKE